MTRLVRPLAVLFSLVGLTAAGWALTPSARAQASMFSTQEVDQTKFIIVAAPIGDGSRAQLNIYEQRGAQRPCYAVSGSRPAVVDPLLASFDFTGICNRFIDGNGYSLRIGTSDLGTVYRLSVVKDSADTLLMAQPTRADAGPEMVIARTGGQGNGFLLLVPEPGWRVMRRSFGNRALGHVYVYRDSWPSEATASKGSPEPAAPAARLSGEPKLPAGPTAPAQPQALAGEQKPAAPAKPNGGAASVAGPGSVPGPGALPSQGAGASQGAPASQSLAPSQGTIPKPGYGSSSQPGVGVSSTPSASAKGLAPTQPGDSAKVADPANAADPAKAANPVKAAAPDKAGPSDKAGAPASAVAPAKPGAPSRAAAPAQAVDPARAGASTPAVPPAKAGAPTKAVEPSKATPPLAVAPKPTAPAPLAVAPSLPALPAITPAPAASLH